MLELRKLPRFQFSRHSCKKEQAPRGASSQIASKRSQTPSVDHPTGIEVSTGIAQTVAPSPVSSQGGASQEVKAMVQDIVKSSLTQLGVILQDVPTQSQAQSSNEEPEHPQTEDISSDGEFSDSDQEDTHSGTPALNQLLIMVEEQADYDFFPSPVEKTRAPQWKFAEQTSSGFQTQLKTATTHAQPVTSTPVKPADPQKQAPAQAQPQA